MKIFPSPTFESITSGLRKTITQLEALTEINDQKSVALFVQIAAQQQTIRDLTSEKNRAASTASKLKSLIE